MENKRYNVLFRGEIIEGTSGEIAKENFAKLFKLDPTKLETLFSGKERVIKKEVETQTAKKYIETLAANGIKCHLEEVLLEPLSSLSLVPKDNEPDEQIASITGNNTKVASGERSAISHNKKNKISPSISHDPIDKKGLNEELKESFYSLVWKEFPTPFKGSGLQILIGGALLFVILDFLMFAPILGVFWAVFSVGYMSSYLLEVLRSRAHGEDLLPDWPPYKGFIESILGPLLQVLGATLLCFSPAIYVYFNINDPGGLLIVSQLIGAFFMPAALISISITRDFASLNPIKLVRLIIKTFKDYVFAVCLLYIIININVSIEIPIPIIGSLIVKLVGVYLLTVEMKIIGLLYYTNRNSL